FHAWRVKFPDAPEFPNWAELLRRDVPIFDLDYEAILAAMYTLTLSAEGDCYLCVPPDPGTAPGIAPAALGACDTTVTPLPAPVPDSLADPSWGAVLARSSTVLPCPAVPSGELSGLHLPSFSTNLVSNAVPQDAGVDTFTPDQQRVAICTCSQTSRHLATFTRAPGSSLYTLTTASRSTPLSPQLHASLPALPPSPAPPCIPCVEGRQRAAPHSCSFPPTEAPLQTLHLDVWGLAHVRGQGHERYFLLVVDVYTRYTTVFPLQRKGDVPDVLIPWICATRLQLRERFQSDFLVLRLHSDRGGEFSSDLLATFSAKHGIRQNFTLPASPQQNGVAERRIGLVMEVAPQPLAPCLLAGDLAYAAVDGEGWRCVATSPFDESIPFYRLFPYRTTPRPLPPLFLAPDPPQVYPLPVPGPASSGVSHVDPPVTGDSGPAGCGAVPGGAELGGAQRGGAEFGGAEGEGPARTESGGAEPACEVPGGPASGGTAFGCAEPVCAEPGGAESGGELPEGSETAVTRSPWSSRLRQRVPLTSEQLHDWYGRRLRRASAPQDSTAGGSSAGITGAGGGAGLLPAGGASVAGPGGARTRGTGAAGAGGVVSDCTGAAGGAAATEAAGGAGAAGAAGAAGGAGAASAGRPAQPRLFFSPPSPSSQPPRDSALRQVLSLPSSTGLPLQPGSLLPAPSPYTEQTGGLAVRREPASRPVSPVHSGHSGSRVPRQRQPAVPSPYLVVRCPPSPPSRVPLPSLPASSLSVIADPASYQFCAEHSTVTCLLATVVTDLSFESATASALVAELVDFAAACRLDYAASLVAESESVCPPSVGAECALGTDVLEDRHEDLECLAAAAPRLVAMLLAPEGDPDAPDIPTPRLYAEAIAGPYSSQWQIAMNAEMASWKSTGTYVDEVPPPGANIVSGMWIFRVKRPSGSLPVFKARYVARGFSQRKGVHFLQTLSPTPKMTTLRVLLHVAAQRDYELHSLDFSTAFLQGSLHEEIWLRRPPGFTGSFPPGTQLSLRRPVYGLCQAPRELHDTLRTTLAALRFAPSTADPSLFLRTDTSLPPFYILVYVEDLVFATADTEALALVKSELQKRHTCTDLGELPSYLGLQITRDRARRTITLTQSHMVQQVLQRFGFTWSSAQATPLATGHSLSAPPSDESVEPSGPYPELVGCLMYLMTCTRPDLAYPLGLLTRYVAPGRHRKVHMDVAKRVLRYLCSTSGMGLVLGGRGDVVLTGHSDASWVDDQATQRSCEAEIYATAMAAQELRWLTYLLTDLGEQPRSPPVLYQRGQLRLAHVATRANTADIFTKALPPCDHQRFCTLLGLVPTLPHFL
ncbi:unnamed protein product, partial [Closterium sp. NIES-53]